MCKIMIMSGIKSDKRQLALEFIEEMASKISNHPNDDGLGYAAISENGKLFGERWFYNDEAFDIRKKPVDDIPLVKDIKDLLEIEDSLVTYNSFGVIDLDNISAITLHARYATSEKVFKNTHPFVDKNTSLIHNGVIRNVNELTLKQSTCDSEAILNEYVSHDVKNEPKRIEQVASKLQGYYACGVFSRVKDKPILDIFKSKDARLFVGYVQELDCLVFTTMNTDLEEVCNQLKLTLVDQFAFKHDIMLRMNPIDGSVIGKYEFNSEHSFKELVSKMENANETNKEWYYEDSFNTWHKRNRIA